MTTQSVPVTWRRATRDDVSTVVALLRDDCLGRNREAAAPERYLDVFARMCRSEGNQQIVGCWQSAVIATYQILFIDGLSLSGARRAQIEGVRVDSALRGRGIGTALLADAEARARAAGCGLLQFTTNADRDRARGFYLRCGYVPSHIGFKKPLA